MKFRKVAFLIGAAALAQFSMVQTASAYTLASILSVVTYKGQIRGSDDLNIPGCYHRYQVTVSLFSGVPGGMGTYSSAMSGSMKTYIVKVTDGQSPEAEIPAVIARLTNANTVSGLQAIVNRDKSIDYGLKNRACYG